MDMAAMTVFYKRGPLTYPCAAPRFARLSHGYNTKRVGRLGEPM